MRKNFCIALIVTILFGSAIFAEEGMWKLDQIKDLNLAKKGLKIPVEKVYNPKGQSIMNSIVLLGGGTSELISDKGLLLTNHHVAFGAVQRASTKGTDYLTNGFLAKNFSEEIMAPGISAEFLLYFKDVSKKVLKKSRKIKDPVKREKAIGRAIKKLTDKIEKGKSDIHAMVASMYNGKQYVLYVFKRYDDVRVVYMPPAAIGNYGGDIDNWMWPRHTGDFAFMRVYTAPDGSGRKYHKDNVPYRPKSWLKVSKTGLKKGDFTFIMGYPGTTTRYRTSSSVDHNLNFNYPYMIKKFSEVITLLDKLGEKSRAVAIKVASLSKGLNNVMKNWQGKVEGMKKSNFLQSKIQFEKELMAFLKKDPKLFKKYGNVLSKIKAQYSELNKTKYHDIAVQYIFNSLYRVANQIVGTIKERAKPKKERNPFFSEKNLKRTVSMLHFRYMSYDETADKALLKYALTGISQLPKDQRVKGLEDVVKGGEKAIDQFIEKAYAKSKLKDVAFAKKLFYYTEKQLRQLKDPLIDMALKLYPENEAIRKQGEKFNAVISKLRKDYIDALYSWKGQNMYPDANRTIRFTYGNVEGYAPRDAVYYSPFTTLKGVIEKDTGKKPFNAPKKLKELYFKKDFGQWYCKDLKGVPVAFTHKCDITGGNSGSPVLDAKGELVGIAFDGNYEAMNGDWQFDEALQRTISVDIRYVLFIVEKFAGATNILKELGI